MQMPEKSILGSIKDLLRNSISSLKDEEHQRKIWFRNEGPEVDSFNEASLHFITSCRYLFKNEKSLDFLGKENYEMLQKLYNLVVDYLHATENKFGDADLINEDELLNDPKWHDIQTLAEEVDAKLTEFIKRDKA